MICPGLFPAEITTQCHLSPFRWQLDKVLSTTGVEIDKVINLEIPDELLLSRITGR
jgi:adenylate kinase family enzyme